MDGETSNHFTSLMKEVLVPIRNVLQVTVEGDNYCKLAQFVDREIHNTSKEIVALDFL